MGFVITIAQKKGGAGKTTLACQLAAALIEKGYRVGALDLDDQKSLTYWARLRCERLGEEAGFRAEAPASYALATALRSHRAAADFVIIDTPPVVDQTVRRAVREADLVLVPLQLTPLDLDATLPTGLLIGEEKRVARFFINRTPPRARVADLIRDQIMKQGLPLLDVEFGARAAFAESIAKGAGVVETAPSSLAADEARRLARIIMTAAGRTIAAA